jgi:prepilin-type N-terminal cleavage/methylation domain-containing protein
MSPARFTSRRAAGFTLIEILVALLILVIMSALGYATYRTARVSAERTETALKRTREIEFGLRTMVQDFAETVPRPVRDVLGESRLPALRGTAGAGTVSAPSNSSVGTGSSSSSSGMSFNSGPGFASQSFGSGASSTTASGFGAHTDDPNVASIVDLTRAGWSNTAGQQRGTLQRVSYALVGDVLKRSYQTSLDTVLGNKPVVQDLLSGVKGVQLRYLDSNQAWQNQWPAATSTPDQYQSRPVAVELIIQFKDWGAIRRLIEVAG